MSGRGQPRKDDQRIRRSKRKAEASDRGESQKKQKNAAQHAEQDHEVVETISLNGHTQVDSSEIWIVGDSIVNHGETYATEHGSQQLGQTRYQIIWLGKSSMRWEQLLPMLQLHMLTRGHPAAIILHVGGNSIASIPQFTL